MDIKADAHQWRLSAEAPSWLAQAILGNSAQAVGAYSVIYSLNEEHVVKLVSEQGALDYLRLCQSARGLPHLPAVHEIGPQDVIDEATGLRYWSVRMERLWPGGARMKRYSEAFVRLVRGSDSKLRNTELSVAATQALARELWPTERALSATLTLLADELKANDWVADLAREDNWMVRPDGTVVMSDPVHEEKNFADDLI